MRWAWRDLANPWCLVGMAWLGIVRGMAYLAGVWTEGYHIPVAVDVILTSQWQLAIVGGAWIVTGAVFGVSVLTDWALRWTSSIFIGVKLTWCVLHVIAMVVEPTWNTLLSISIHAVLIATLFTLVQVEIKAYRDIEERKELYGRVDT